uniref:NAD(P)(+)--arginine ADP-ribosyltransferase n=2 Tax=Monodelphis domestica TaxID=13616 RepID=A0A5F8GI51_MONDO
MMVAETPPEMLEKCLLTIAVVPYVIFIWLQIPQVRGKTLPLDMAPNSFDDAYIGCVEEMEQIAPFLFQEEMAQHQVLRESWEAATAFLKSYQNLSLPPGFTTQHAMAVIVYTNSSNILHRELNSAVRTLGSSIDAYMEQFPFKALHFYLMRALQLLRDPESCKEDSGQEVFRGVGNIHFEPRKLGESIRFGQFTSTSEEWKVAQMYGNATLFTLSTCFGASIKRLSVFPNEREVLIPPNEVFQVSNFSQEGTRNLVTLRSLNWTYSNFNCVYLKRKKSQNSVFKTGKIPDASIQISQLSSHSYMPFSLCSFPCSTQSLFPLLASFSSWHIMST